MRRAHRHGPNGSNRIAFPSLRSGGQRTRQQSRKSDRLHFIFWQAKHESMQSLGRKSLHAFAIKDQAFTLGRATLKLAAKTRDYAAILPTAVIGAKLDAPQAAPK
jgi:hypothetical protein